MRRSSASTRCSGIRRCTGGSSSSRWCRRSCCSCSAARCGSSLVAAAAVVVTWLGLLISFSQSSFAALLVVVIGAAFVAWRWRALVAVVLAVAVLAGISVAQPQIRRSIQHHTSQRAEQRDERPVEPRRERDPDRGGTTRCAGVGVGGFKRAYADRVHLKGKEPKKAASHNTPVTVAAETGLVGLALFAWLLVARCSRRRSGARPRAAALVAGLGIAAIFCHSLFYNAFFEDPMTWALFGLVALASPRLVPVPAPSRRPRSPRRRRCRSDRAVAAGARAGAAHRRRRVRLRRHDGAARRRRLRGALRRVLDRDALAAGGLPARHARARGARGDDASSASPRSG